MVCVTVEDCIDKVENRFELVLLASHRARHISQGARSTISAGNDKNTVVSLREIANGNLSPGDLEEDFIHSLQKHVEVDEPNSDANSAFSSSHQSDSGNEFFWNPSEAPPSFEEMSEVALLEGIDRIIPPDKRDDY
ncbi:MAG: DNA-directed RNA polymerase subunit omega [Candidatus Liberibacter ctenarytainae]|uniref:DNA-directed RNA polymerase subunit omega n=1 Tax=Candidatus Liberibacter ctenarytainae TaxID=2020335 RepID=A0A937DJ34_9HYPH|nr:DNA-directed RNA polymerase subunit omega [Candidatus Liberibacter ctenarytainae]